MAVAKIMLKDSEKNMSIKKLFKQIKNRYVEQNIQITSSTDFLDPTKTIQEIYIQITEHFKKDRQTQMMQSAKFCDADENANL